MSWPIKKNDRDPPYRGRLLAGGLPVDFTGKTVRFLMKNHATGVAKVAAPAHVMTEEERVAVGIPAGEEGWVEYAWGATDTDTAGTYRAEWEVTAAGKTRTFPARGYLFIEVVDDLG